nr:hypothetical protein [Tanacetum cinerariifolium]
MPISIYNRLTNKNPIGTDIRLSLASYSYIYPLGIAEDVLIDIAGYVYLMDFVILGIEEDKNKPFILRTPFLTTAKAEIRFDNGTITLKSGKNNINFFKILESLCKIKRKTEEDIDPITLINIVSRRILEWEERIKNRQEKEMGFNKWISKVFDDEYLTSKKEDSDCQPMDQNNDSFGLDQIQSPQYPRIHHPSQADVEEVLHDREKFMQDTQTFLEKFNRFSFGFTPRVLTIAWERIDKIKYVLTEPEEILDLMYKHREDVQNIRVELAEYIDSPIWNCPIFFYEEDEEYTIQYREYLEKSPDAVTTVLPNEEPEDCQFSRGNGVEEENVVYQEKEEVDLEDIFQIQGIVLCEKLLSITRLISNIESLNDNPTPDCVLNSSVSIPIFEESDNSLSNNFSPEFKTFCDHTEETKSGNTTTHVDDSLPEYDSFCFEIKPGQDRLINVLKNDIPDDLRDPLLEEADLFLASDNSIPSDAEFDFEPDAEEEIPVVMNEKDEFDDYIPFMFVIRIFMPYLICSKMFICFLSAESEDTIFDPGFTPHRLKFLVFGYLSRSKRSSHSFFEISLGKSISLISIARLLFAAFMLRPVNIGDNVSF